MLKKIYVYIAQKILILLPLYSFPKLNTFIFRSMGYKISKNARIFSSAKIFGNFNLEIGDNTFIGNESVITGGDSFIKIGSNCDISDRVSIFSGSHEIGVKGNRRAGKGISKDIKIGKNVWIGYGSLILPGVTIEDDSIVAAGSVVIKDVKSNTIVGGNPAKIIKVLDD